MALDWGMRPWRRDARGGSPARRALSDGLVVAGLLFAAYLFLILAPEVRTLGFDAYAYWSVNDVDPYRMVAGELGAFPYSPVAVRLFDPVGAVSWVDFLWVWEWVLIGTALWLGGRRALLVLAFPPVAIELYHGNIHLLIAAAIALGFRYPVFWAVPLLTKVTPGVGLVWFAARREWRHLGIALAFTAMIAVVSLAIDGRLWVVWIREGLLGALSHPVAQPSIAIPLVVRLPAALAIVFWGARTDRAWTVPLAATLALPILWVAGFSILAAIPAIERIRRSSAHGPDRAPAT